MRIRLTTDIVGINVTPEDGCVAGKEFDAVLIHPRSSTVEFESDLDNPFRAFHYEYEKLEEEEEVEED